MAKRATRKRAVKNNLARTPPYEQYPEWTTARFFGFIRSALRAASSRYPPKYECLNKATRPYVGPDKRRKKERQCAICLGWFPTTQTEADHIVPAGSLRSWEDLVPFTQRLFCGVDGFRCLCKECHKKVTAEQKENKEC